MKEIEILFENSDFVVAVKEPELLSEESDKPNMVTLLSEKIGSKVFPVHRLDKPVSGVMVYAKNEKAAAELSRQVRERVFKKEYIALVWGSLNEKSGEMRDLLFKDSRKNKTFVVKRMRKGVREAVLKYECLNIFETKDKEAVTAVKINLLTGRSHQIRVQFASRKHPLLGDRRYGSKDSEKRLMLFSSKIVFISPSDKKEVTFVLPNENLPKEIVDAAF